MEENLIDNYRKNLFDLQERAVRMYNPTFTEEEIQLRCAHLRKQIIDGEENRPMNEKLAKIWGKKKWN